MSEDSDRKPKKRDNEPTPLIEWVVGALSAVLVAGLVLYLGYEALFADDRPAQLEVAIERIDVVDNGAVVTIAVANRGDKAASAVTVNASAPDDEGNAFQKQVEFDFIAANAVERGAFLFPHSVAADDLNIEIGGYSEP